MFFCSHFFFEIQKGWPQQKKGSFFFCTVPLIFFVLSLSHVILVNILAVVVYHQENYSFRIDKKTKRTFFMFNKNYFFAGQRCIFMFKYLFLSPIVDLRKHSSIGWYTMD